MAANTIPAGTVAVAAPVFDLVGRMQAMGSTDAVSYMIAVF